MYFLINIYIRGRGGLGNTLPGPAPGPGFQHLGDPRPRPGTRFNGESPAPVGAGEPGSPTGRGKSPSLVVDMVPIPYYHIGVCFCDANLLDVFF